MTESEKQVIIDAVLSALRTNSRTIEQLTPVSSLSESDYFEVNGGRRIAYAVLAKLIATLSESEQSNLQTAIDRKELQSVTVTTTQSSATLTIKSVGKTIQCPIPIATSSQSGFITAADKVKLDSAYSNANSALTQANNAKKAADNAKSAAETAQEGVDALNSKIGVAGGIATLDSNGKVPSRFIPDAYDDVKEFGAKVSGVSITPVSVNHNSTDANCMVVYDNDTNTLLLAVANTAIADADWRIVNKKSILEQISPQTEGTSSAGITKADIWQVNDSLEVALVTRYFTYYCDWLDGNLFGVATVNGRVPVEDKQYVDTSANCNYRWSGSTLVSTGSDLALGHTANTAFPGDEGVQLQEDLEGLAGEHSTLENKFNNLSRNVSMMDMSGVKFINLNEVVDNSNPYHSLKEALSIVPEQLRQSGAVVRLWIEKEDTNGNIVEKWETYQWTKTPFDEDADWEDESQWEPFGGGGSAIGNVYNATAEDPLGVGLYYTLEAVIAKAFEKGYNKLGLGITFEAKKKQWESYQYIGATTDWEEFKEKENWLDNAALSEGDQPFINVNQVFGAGPVGGYYPNLSYAIAKVIEKDPDKKYRKPGVVLHYQISEFEWETKVFKGPVSSFGTESLWADFGGASKIEAKDEPEEEGKDAFSTGGAAKYITVTTEQTVEDGELVTRYFNALGEECQDATRVALPTGGGGDAGGTNIVIKTSAATVYAAYGAAMEIGFSIRSVTTAGNSEQENNIEKIEIVDKTTNQVLKSWTGSQASSVSDTDFSFKFDLKDLFTAAGEKSLKVVATDELGKTNSKSFKAVAEDVTLTCQQVLNYDADNIIRPTDDNAGFDCYQFKNAASDIRAFVDILINGEWVNIHNQVCSGQNRNVTRRVTFSPKALGLQHGAYQIRMYGVSEASGVKGNTVYSGIMAVDSDSDKSMVVLRYNDLNNGEIRNYETVSIELAAYKPGNVGGLIVDTALNGTRINEILALSNHTYTISKQITGFQNGAELSFQAHIGAIFSEKINLVVSGSAVDVALKDGSFFNFDFSGRDNNESDHSIVDGDTVLTLNGVNYTTNGFCKYKDSDTESALRIAENVTGSINFSPFASNTLESTGAVIQWTHLTDNVRDPDSLLMECYDPTAGAGFYVKGNEVAIFCRNGVTNSIERRPFTCGTRTTCAVVVEPASNYIERGGIRYSSIYLYIDGEKVAKIGYVPGNGHLLNTRNISFNGTEGDLYLYDIAGWRSYMEWFQAMGNNLARKHDVAAMVKEFNFENVLASQTAEGVTEMRPQHAELWARGIPYVIEVASQEEFDKFDGLDQFRTTGENTGSGEAANTSTDFYVDLYYYFPSMPWRSFIAYRVRKRRQGTTSGKRCKKNPRYYIGTATRVVPMFPNYAQENQLTTAQLQDLMDTYALFEMKYVRVGENTMPVQTITVKIDFSDATGANDCGVCDMTNATYRALGPQYMTPAQRAYTGRWDKGDVHLTGIEMNHSTANHPCAVFRCTDSTLSNVFFEAKGNWKEDKGEQYALGFKDVDGYTKGCINYQDEAFIEVFAPKGLGLNEYVATDTFKAIQQTWDQSELYLLSPYCGRNYKFFRFNETDGQWQEQTGSMRQVNGKWIVEGTVLNPVDGYEMLVYDGFCWWQGVSSVEDMMAPTTQTSSWVKKLVDKGKVSASEFPMWTQYFECMVDNDQLAIDYAMGRKVPFNLYNMLRAFDAVDYSKHDDWKERWRLHQWKYMSVRSSQVYHGLTDYNCMFDQRAKNKQPMFFLEDGHEVVDGVYDPTREGADESDGFNYEFILTSYQQPMIMYDNKVYDGDGANGADNDGGYNADPETDPDVMDESNPYKGWGSIQFVNMAQQPEMVVDAEGHTVSLRDTISAMRSCQIDLADGSRLNPFSPAGAIYYFCTMRTEIWPKNVSSYDGYRKYEKYTESSDAIYFYALQGLRRTSLPQFITTRWRFRDGYYRVGDFFGGVISGRAFAPTGSRIKIVAAKSGYFGIGNDASGNLSESVYLEAGQTHYFTMHKAGSESLLYIYQADRLAEIDLSEIALANDWSFDNLKLVEKLTLGSETYVRRPVGSNGLLSSLPLGSKPFLHTLDIRGREITSVNASGCPRIAHIYATGSDMGTLTLAETSPINDIQLPDCMVDVRFVGLPNLTYTGLNSGSGLQVANLARIQTLVLETSPKLDAMKMLHDVLSGQSAAGPLTYLRISGMSIRGNGKDLMTLIERGVKGIDGTAMSPKPIINGTYMLEALLDQSEIDEIESGIQGITVQIVVEAFIDTIDQVNGEYYTGDAEVPIITLDNIGEHLAYYNGETYTDYMERVLADNESIHNVITQ